MGIVTKQITLNKEIKKVWKFITNSENFSKYVYSYSHGKVISPNKVGVGAKYEWYGKIGSFKLKSIEEIVEWQNLKRVAYKGEIFHITFNSSMLIKKAELNKTVLDITIKYRVPIYFGGNIIDFLFIKKVVESSLQKSLANLNKIFQ